MCLRIGQAFVGRSEADLRHVVRQLSRPDRTSAVEIVLQRPRSFCEYTLVAGTSGSLLAYVVFCFAPVISSLTIAFRELANKDTWAVILTSLIRS